MSFASLLLPLFILSHIFLCYSAYIENNAYKDIVIAFAPSVRYDDVDIDKLKDLLQESSSFLFQATRRRSYFSKFIVSLPFSWPRRLCDQSNIVNSIPSGIDVYVTNPGESETGEIKTQHSQGCGKSGEIIYIPISSLQGDVEAVSRQFVQQWATYRYGVFKETPFKNKNDCSLIDDNETWSPVGCYNSKVKSSVHLDDNGLPVCNVNNDSSSVTMDITSSIMFNTDSSNVTNFCDGSTVFPHIPFMPTMHNVFCQGRPVWKVIEENADFQFGVNSPVNDEFFEPKASIECYHEDDIINIFFAVQNASLMDITNIVTELRISLLRFHLYEAVETTTRSTLLVFSDKAHTKIVNAINLDLTKPEEVANSLREYIRVAEQIDSVCLTCPVEKLLQLNEQEVPNANSVAVFFILASSINTTTSIEFAEKLGELKQKIYLIVIRDQSTFTLHSNLAKTVYSSGGQLFEFSNDPVFMRTRVNLVLASLLRSSQHVEDDVVVVHEATYSNIKEDIVDKFTLDDDLNGKLVYTLKCSNNDMINVKDPKCTNLENIPIGAYQCGMSVNSNDLNRSWEFNFNYLPGIPKLTCSTLATVTQTDLHKTPQIFRGWLSHNVVRPGHEALIIYAEFLKDYSAVSNIQIEAHVQRPPDSEPFILDLRDNGNGDPDIKKGDGIYSRYFTNFTAKGVYTVKIRMSSLQDKNEFSTSDTQLDMGNFSRTSVIGSFVLETEPPSMDIYPPNRIADLIVTSIDHVQKTITLQWTAPGDNYDYGQVEAYEVLYSPHWQDMTDLILSKKELGFLDPSDNLEDKIKEASGIIVTAQYEIPRDGELYYIAVRATDKNGNKGKLSNAIQVRIALAGVQSTDTTKNVNLSSTEVPVEKQEFGHAFKFHEILLMSVCGSVLLLLIIINCLVWRICYKRSNQNKRETELSLNRTTENENSSAKYEVERNNDSTSTYMQYHNLGYNNNDAVYGFNANEYQGPHPNTKTIPQYGTVSKIRANMHYDKTTDNRTNETERDMGLV